MTTTLCERAGAAGAAGAGAAAAGGGGGGGGSGASSPKMFQDTDTTKFFNVTEMTERPPKEWRHSVLEISHSGLRVLDSSTVRRHESEGSDRRWLLH